VTLTQLLDADIATLRQYALVFGKPLANVLTAKWGQHGNTNCVPSPVLLTDGRYLLSADILSEVADGRLLGKMWRYSDKAVIAAGIEVLSWKAATALIPATGEG